MKGPTGKPAHRGPNTPVRSQQQFREPWEDSCPPVMFFVILAFQGTVIFLLLRHFGIITFI